MLIPVMIMVVGLVLLVVGSDHLVIGAGRLASRLGIAPVMIGIVVIGLGTSAPELLVSTVAAARGHGALAIGNLVGSNVLNVTLVLGIVGLTGPFAISSSIVRREAPLSVAAVGAFALALFLGLGVMAGIVLAVLLLVTVVVLGRLARSGDDVMTGEVADFLDGTGRFRAWPEGVRATAGLAATLGGAELVVGNAADIAARLGISPTIIGFGLVACGTSLPELFTAIQAQRRGETDLVVGNLLGSNLFNSLGAGAAVGLTRSGPASIGGDLIVIMVAVSALAWFLLIRGLRLTRPESGLLLLAYALTLPFLIS
jgi:cation:H+ antiporter